MTDSNNVREAGMDWAKNKYVENFIESNIADRSDSFPKFVKEDIKLGKVLGKGGFGTVYEVRGIKIDENGREGDEAHFIAGNCIREDSGDARYAIKVLSPEVVRDDGQFIQGSIDMATETRVLSDTEHPNIIKARAFANASPFSEIYFIMMDRLYDTMEGRIEVWKKKIKRFSGIGGKLLDRNGSKKKDIWEARLVAAFDLSDAIGYLHRRNIVYRDLKPENIGFDVRDDVKLFDFGLAVELKDSRKVDDDLYRLTGMTGSPRYMPPEVANGEHYNEKCDTYSFAILLWEMLSLKNPFELYTMKKFESRVWNGQHKRPFIDPLWPEPIKELLGNSWQREINGRPAFSVITEQLRKQIVITRGGDDKGLEHNRRRSTNVFDRSALTKMFSVTDFLSKRTLLTLAEDESEDE